MEIDILTLFPGIVSPMLQESIVKRAQEKGIVRIRIHDLRTYSTNKHKKADDRPFGGGPGMVLSPDPLFRAITALKKKNTRVIYLTPDGVPLTQRMVKQYAGYKHILFLCGHYEGIDERIRKKLVTDEISIGDYVVTGGELPAMVMTDAMIRILPGVLGCKDSSQEESFEQGLLDWPHYTRPEIYQGMRVPQVLLSGDHIKIQQWRRIQAFSRTKKRRPDLLKK